MKKLIIMILLMGILYARAQETIHKDIATQEMSLVKGALNNSFPKLNSAQSIEILNREALKGNGRAMNGLGIQYIQGRNMPRNVNQGLEWFEKAGKNGYSTAYNNLGSIYQEGEVVPQDFEKALLYYKKGAEQNNPQSFYMIGYMAYKGLAGSQNYGLAVTMFKQAIALGNIPATYFLGLCFRNGYGIDVNIDSARYWLKISAEHGNNQAINELAAPNAERKDLGKNQALKSEKKRKIRDVITIPNVRQSFNRAELPGVYEGTIKTYDWSGKNIVGTNNLTVQIGISGNKILGTWTEENGTAVPISADITTKNIHFNNMEYEKAGHYRPMGEHFTFRDASLRLSRRQDTLFLEGNLKLWSVERREPGKPIYVSMSRVVQSVAKDSTLSPVKKLARIEEGAKGVKEIESTQFVAYPNPFSNTLQVKFNIVEATKVNISIINMVGQIVHSEKGIALSSGAQSRDIDTNKLPIGVYVLKMEYNGYVKSTVVIKQ